MTGKSFAEDIMGVELSWLEATYRWDRGTVILSVKGKVVEFHQGLRGKAKTDTREGEQEVRTGLKVQGCLSLLKQQEHRDLFVLHYHMFQEVCLISPSAKSSAWPAETEECMGRAVPVFRSFPHCC